MSLKIGQKIKHPQHGVGIVKSIDGDDAVVDFETGMEKEEKGVHMPDNSTTYIKDGKVQQGISRAGIKTREASAPSSFEEYETSPKIAKEIHTKKLNELKNMPKPNLPKSEEMSKDDMPHEPNSPEDKAHDIVEEGDSIQQALAILDTPEKQKQMFEHLRALVEQSEHRSEENQEVGQESEEGMEKARVDEGFDLEGKVRARQKRNAREVISTKTPTGLDTRTARSTRRREQELETGKDEVYDKFDEQGRPMRVRMIPDERRMGEKIVGTPRTMQTGTPEVGGSGELSYGVHMHSGSMAGKDSPVGGGKNSSAPVYADAEGKSYVTGGTSGGSFGSKQRHAQITVGQSRINPNLPKSEEGMEKSEYSAREVAIAVLKKAESMAREWQNSKPEKVMQDSVLSEKRDVVNENDIIDAASQAMTDKSPLRLKAWIEARKAKK